MAGSRDISKELKGWTVTLVFDEEVNSLEVWIADVKQKLDEGRVYVLENKSWNTYEHVGDELCINFIGRGNGDANPGITAYMTQLPDGGSYNGATAPSSQTSTPSTHAQATSQMPMQSSSQMPSQSSSQMPMQSASQIPMQSSSQMPSQSTSQMPSQSSSQLPSQSSSQMPSQLSSQMPSQSSSQMPMQSTTQTPVAPPPTGDGIKVNMTVTQDWGERFEGQFDFLLTDDVIGWMVNITYSKPVTKMDIFIEHAISHSADGRSWVVVDKQDRPYVQAGDTLSLKFFGNYPGGIPAPTAQAVLTNLGVDHWKVDTKNNTDGSKYNYDDLLYKSILFYEAQRSGKLPANNRIPYRGDSALGDKGDNGEDLTGGWYDAGDHVKFNFPMAFSTAALTWGFLQFQDAYEAAGQTDYMLECIKWPLDYLLKCHTKPHELYAQVGDGGSDHSYWGRPEQMTMARPAYKIDESKPGSDLAMDTAAAFSVGYLVF